MHRRTLPPPPTARDHAAHALDVAKALSLDLLTTERASPKTIGLPDAPAMLLSMARSAVKAASVELFANDQQRRGPLWEIGHALDRELDRLMEEQRVDVVA